MLREKGPCVNQGEGLSGVSSSQLSASGQSSPGPQPWEAVSVLRLTLSFLLLAGEQTKALVTQLTLFNRVLSELREDIRDQVGLGGLLVLPGLDFPRAECQHPPDAPCSAALQVKEMSLIRNTIMECQVCGECWQRLCSHLGGQRATLSQPSPASPFLRLPRAAVPLQPQSLLQRRGLHGDVRVPRVPLRTLPAGAGGQRHALR